ncbi:hypothetical protein [Cellulomonas soli]|uniref:Uncharacterized protein n=1 Tax=Cellulomonas soli TaxID=931535 RepID=A0A512PFI0_9CELL|nr:hypothetical protein [Cellulomonas soli]NYI59892.1 hypothetical protein [Cellulomonas soli]GEP69964.1 hypothetical protein CSO01_26790 [Cellulomonas soli]
MPTLGQFTSVDPIEGGADNGYSYPTDPNSQFDLDGKKINWGEIGDVLSMASVVTAFCPLPTCQAVTVALGAASPSLIAA